ncbi:LysR family transcriptional regulator [Shewanella waksmanii]|uniref:LysR family transcriptional regulator n=1 Tax=Shewanella waksmanii TaxID=213783 RepID=UPI0004916BD4|nr:LysR family transcriptional regulator [Shewanella waksmanii]
MAKDVFSKLDLNLLKTFIVLSQECNMRKASERLFVSQPAISKSLQRLRYVFEDELFVKTYHGLKATELAKELAQNIEPLMNELTNAVNYTGGFNPSEINSALKIAISPFLLTGIAQRLFTQIRNEAPHAEVQFLHWNKSTVQDIVDGKIHLGLNYNLDNIPKELLNQTVATENFKAYVRHNHPYDKELVEIQEGTQFEFATLMAADWNYNHSIAEKLLKSYGLDIRMGFRSELPSAVIEVVKSSDMIFLSSKYLDLASDTSLKPLDISFGKIPFNTDINLYYHNKDRQSHTNLWLRKKVANALAV